MSGRSLIVCAVVMTLAFVLPARAQLAADGGKPGADFQAFVEEMVPLRIGGAEAAWIDDTLGVTVSQVLSVNVPDAPVESMRFVLPIDGALRTLTLWRRSVRAEGYQIYESLPGGGLRPIVPGPVNTYRGRVDELPGSTAGAAWIDGQLRATIFTGDGSRYELQPLTTINGRARHDEHVLYRADDLLARAATCGTPTAGIVDPGGGIAGKGGGQDTCIARLGCDADFPFFQVFGSVSAVEDEINAVINGVNVQYESQVGITHQISGIIVRTSAAADPYTATNSLDLVCQFSREWSANVSIDRDAAHLFTNRVTGSDIGRAAEIGSICEPDSCPFFPCVCNSQFGTEGSYAFSRTEFDPSFACSTDVVAHQLGHLWGASHCNCPGFTMNPFTTCDNQFSQASIDSIVAYRDTRPCIDCSGLLVNNLCEGRIEIFDGDTPFDSTGATTDGPPAISCAAASQAYNDLWYNYTATCTGELTVSTCNQAQSGFDTVLIAYDGCDCSELVQLGCNDDFGGCSGFTSFLQVPVIGGNCYKIRVGGWNPGDAGTATLSVSCEPTTPPNDLCMNAEPLFNGETTYDMTGAGGENPILCDIDDPKFAGGIFPDIYYTYMSDFTGQLTVSACSEGLVNAIEAYNLCDCPPDLESCLGFASCIELGNGDCPKGCFSELTIDVEEGGCYLIRILQMESVGGGTITVSKSFGPPNDLCESALPIINGPTGYDMTGAAADGPFACIPDLVTGSGPDVFYTYQASFTGDLTIEVCTFNDLNAVVVYDGCGCPPDPITCLGSASCNFPEGGGAAEPSCICVSQLTVSVVEGQCYLIQIIQMTGVGPGQIFLSKTIGPPVNDLCNEALPLLNGETSYDMTGAGGEGPQLCDVVGLGPVFPPDIFYTYDADFNGELTVSVCTDPDINAIEVFGADTCPPDFKDCLASSTCPVGGGSCVGCFAEVTFDVGQGQTYLIRILQSLGDGGGTITVSKSIDSCPGARLDFGVTPDDFGDANTCPVGEAGLSITTQYVNTQSVVFGTAVDSFQPPTVYILENVQCNPSCRSGTVFTATNGNTDWWCQFRFGRGPGTPGLRVGVTSFSAELCPITPSVAGGATMIGYNLDQEMVAQAFSTQTGTETLTITAPQGVLIAYVQVSQPGGVTVDCLSYPDPQAPIIDLCPWDCGDGGDGVVDIVDILALLAQWDEPGSCDFDDSGTVNIVDLLALLANTGACPYPAACGAGTGDCYINNGTPGCNDLNCCAEICANDPFCCDTEWDQICADAAIATCLSAAAPGDDSASPGTARPAPAR